MKIYLQSRSLDEIKSARDYGFIDGVDLAHPDYEGQNFPSDTDRNLLQVARTIRGPVFADLHKMKHDEILENSRRIIGIAPNIVLKFKVCLEGFKICRMLSTRDIPVYLSGIENLTQLTCAAKAGASFVSFNHLDNGLLNCLICDSSIMAKKYSWQCEIIAAHNSKQSSPDDLIKSGADAISLPFGDLLDQMKSKIP